MPTKVERRTVDLSQFPELVVIYLGMRVNRIDRAENAVWIRSQDLGLGCGAA